MAKAGISLHAIQEKDGYYFSLQHTFLLFSWTFIEWWNTEGGSGFNALSFLNNELLKVLLMACLHEPLRQKKKNPFSGNTSHHLHRNTEKGTTSCVPQTRKPSTRWSATITRSHRFFYKPRRHHAPWLELLSPLLRLSSGMQVLAKETDGAKQTKKQAREEVLLSL